LEIVCKLLCDPNNNHNYRFGERLVRVFNLRLPVVTTLFNVFKGSHIIIIITISITETFRC
jgi:hypothetical protein